MAPRGRATTTSVNLLPSDFVGQRVELQGLTARADLNGQVGVAKSYDSARGRLAVALDSGEGAAMSDGFWGSGPPLLVRPAHLRLVELETGAVTAAAQLHTYTAVLCLTRCSRDRWLAPSAAPPRRRSTG